MLLCFLNLVQCFSSVALLQWCRVSPMLLHSDIRKIFKHPSELVARRYCWMYRLWANIMVILALEFPLTVGSNITICFVGSAVHVFDSRFIFDGNTAGWFIVLDNYWVGRRRAFEVGTVQRSHCERGNPWLKREGYLLRVIASAEMIGECGLVVNAEATRLKPRRRRAWEWLWTQEG